MKKWKHFAAIAQQRLRWKTIELGPWKRVLHIFLLRNLSHDSSCTYKFHVPFIHNTRSEWHSILHTAQSIWYIYPKPKSLLPLPKLKKIGQNVVRNWNKTSTKFFDSQKYSPSQFNICVRSCFLFRHWSTAALQPSSLKSLRADNARNRRDEMEQQGYVLPHVHEYCY